MKKIFFILCFLASTFIAESQNLVPNGDFESYTSCPSATGSLINLAAPWYDPTGATPDYFNVCAPVSCYCSVPDQTGGLFQYAHSGVAYAGIWIYQHQETYREYIQVQLTQVMAAGVCYDVEFYANLSNQLKVGCNNLGAYISNTIITTSPPQVLNYTPQIVLAGNAPIVDTVNWIKISGTYTAAGGEKYITIGNFNSDSSTVTEVVDASSPFNGAYYYIDDVSITACLPATISTYDHESLFTVFPNPGDGNITLHYTIRQNDKAFIQVYDAMGNVVKEETLNAAVNERQLALNLDKGIYLYRIVVNGSIVKSDKLIIIK